MPGHQLCRASGRQCRTSGQPVLRRQRALLHDDLAGRPRGGTWHCGTSGREVAGAVRGGRLQQRATGPAGEPLQQLVRDSALADHVLWHLLMIVAPVTGCHPLPNRQQMVQWMTAVPNRVSIAMGFTWHHAERCTGRCPLDRQGRYRERLHSASIMVR